MNKSYYPRSFGSKQLNRDVENLFSNVKNDHNKYKKLKENNVPFTAIPYWDIKRIPEILDDFFKGIEPIYSQPPKVVVEYEAQRKLIEKQLT